MLLEIEPEIAKEYQRFLGGCGDFERLPKPCLSIDDVLKAHFLIANHFYLEGEGIGGIGPKSIDLLQSAIYRQVISLGGTLKWERLFDVTATLFFGIIKNHAFHDANKRTAFLTALYQLYVNGFCPTVHESVFEDLTVEVAENQLEKYSRFRDLKSRNFDDPEVMFISKWLQQNTRRVDNFKRSITFRELDIILRKNGYYLENPQKNHIEVVKYEEKRMGLFGFGKKETVRVHLGRIGFPSWGKEVGHATLKHVRDMTELSPKHGMDNAAFFDGLDPIQSLIATYNEPLMRLAYR